MMLNEILCFRIIKHLIELQKIDTRQKAAGTGLDNKLFWLCQWFVSGGKSTAQGLVENPLEASSLATGAPMQMPGHIIIQSQCRSHFNTLMPIVIDALMIIL
jgi:hypothetical protein